MDRLLDASEIEHRPGVRYISGLSWLRTQFKIPPLTRSNPKKIVGFGFGSMYRGPASLPVLEKL